MGEKFIKQHIVPQAYLNRFAFEDKNKRQKVIGIRLSSQNNNEVKIFTNSVTSVGYINNYYDTLQKEDKKHWEHYFDENFDTLCGNPLDNIISTITLSTPDVQVINPEAKSILSRIILSQSVRVPAYLDDQMEKTLSFIDSYKTKFIEQNPSLPINTKQLIKQITFDNDMRKDIILDSVFNKEHFHKYCNILEQKTWIAYFNNIRNELPFVTSDNPVLFCNLKGTPTKIDKIGLISNKLAIFYPLTPSILIGIYSPHAYLGLLKHYDGKRFNINETKFIININLKIMSQSYKHSFLPKPLFQMVKDIK